METVAVIELIALIIDTVALVLYIVKDKSKP